MNIKDALEYGINELKEKNIEEPILKTKILLAYILNCKKEDLLIHETEEIDTKTINIYKENINKVCSYTPLQYVTKIQEFMDLSFYVDERALIPQPDTENLVYEVIELLKNKENVDILDLCTGSGAIAISLKKNLPNAKIVGTDISKDALEVAKINAKNNNAKIDFIKSDLFEKVQEQYNAIISNPPYIKTKIIKTLDKEVQKEPILALDGGQDGLDFYKKIIKDAYKYLKPDGYLCLEIGYDQKEEVINLINENGNYKEVYSKKDLAGNDRIVICKIK